MELVKANVKDFGLTKDNLDEFIQVYDRKAQEHNLKVDSIKFMILKNKLFANWKFMYDNDSIEEVRVFIKNILVQSWQESEVVV